MTRISKPTLLTIAVILIANSIWIAGFGRDLPQRAGLPADAPGCIGSVPMGQLAGGVHVPRDARVVAAATSRSETPGPGSPAGMDR